MKRIIGQQHAVGVIESAIGGSRMHHAWIFRGPAGVGKATAAIETAKIILCHDRGDRIEACGQCASCRYFHASAISHPDLHLIHKELAAVSEFKKLRDRKQMNISVDLLRERMIGGWIGPKESRKYIEPAVGRKSTLRHGKVFIIDEAELLAAEGQNILLKTLEEPPADTYIFLITSHEDRLLPTIRSRCQRVAFNALDDEAVARWLDDHLKQTTAALQQRQAALCAEKKTSREQKKELAAIEQQLKQYDLSAAARGGVVDFARGSPGRALMAIEYGLMQWQATVDAMLERIGRGRPVEAEGAALADLVNTFAAAWVDAHPGASKDAANKAGVREMLGLLGHACRRRLRDASCQMDAADLASAEQSVAVWLRGVDLIHDAERQLAANVSPPLLLENLAIQWSQTQEPQSASR